MTNLPPDSKAIRHEALVVLVAFVVGSGVVLAALGCLILYFRNTETSWRVALPVAATAVWASILLGGFTFATISAWGMGRYRYWRGFYRCCNCNRPLKDVGIACNCRETPPAE